MNYRSNTIREISHFANEFEDYSVGDIFYSICRKLNIKKLSDLRNRTDEEFFTAVNTAIEEEQEVN